MHVTLEELNQSWRECMLRWKRSIRVGVNACYVGKVTSELARRVFYAANLLLFVENTSLSAAKAGSARLETVW